MKKEFFKKVAVQVLLALVVAGPVLAQSLGGQLQGQGGSQISAFAHQIVSFVFYVCLVGIIIMGSVVGYKLTHDKQGWDYVKSWVAGLAFLFLVDAIAAYFMFAAQSAGLNTQGTLF
jgi:hypothetical protein